MTFLDLHFFFWFAADTVVIAIYMHMLCVIFAIFGILKSKGV